MENGGHSGGSVEVVLGLWELVASGCGGGGCGCGPAAGSMGVRSIQVGKSLARYSTSMLDIIRDQ